MRRQFEYVDRLPDHESLPRSAARLRLSFHPFVELLYVDITPLFCASQRVDPIQPDSSLAPCVNCLGCFASPTAMLCKQHPSVSWCFCGFLGLGIPAHKCLSKVIALMKLN